MGAGENVIQCDLAQIPSWEDMLIKKASHVRGYVLRVVFRNGAVKEIDIEPYIRRHPKIFRELIERPERAAGVRFCAIDVFWNDLMGIEAQTLYGLNARTEREMSIKKQFIVIRIAPSSPPETRVATLPYVDLTDVETAIRFLKENSLLPAAAELDERNAILTCFPETEESEDEYTDDLGDRQGFYLVFTAEELHYHVIVKDVIL